MANSNGHYTHENNQSSGVALAHTVHGSPANATMRQESATEGSVRQVQSVFSDYKPPKRRAHDKGHILCSEEGCKAYPQDGKNYCTGHARLHGEAKTCNHRDCKAPPKKGTDYCRWHSTVTVTDEPD